MKDMLRHRRDEPVPQHTLPTKVCLRIRAARQDCSFSFETTATGFACKAFALAATAAHLTSHERQADLERPC